MKNLNEVKRLQKLAGINEIKINSPYSITPEIKQYLDTNFSLISDPGQGNGPNEGEIVVYNFDRDEYSDKDNYPDAHIYDMAYRTIKHLPNKIYNGRDEWGIDYQVSINSNDLVFTYTVPPFD